MSHDWSLEELQLLLSCNLRIRLKFRRKSACECAAITTLAPVESRGLASCFRRCAVFPAHSASGSTCTQCQGSKAAKTRQHAMASLSVMAKSTEGRQARALVHASRMAEVVSTVPRSDLHKLAAAGMTSFTTAPWCHENACTLMVCHATPIGIALRTYA